MIETFFFLLNWFFFLTRFIFSASWRSQQSRWHPITNGENLAKNAIVGGPPVRTHTLTRKKKMTSSLSCTPEVKWEDGRCGSFLGRIYRRNAKQTVQRSTLCICKSWLVQLEGLRSLSNVCQSQDKTNTRTETGARTAAHAALNYI